MDSSTWSVLLTVHPSPKLLVVSSDNVMFFVAKKSGWTAEQEQENSGTGKQYRTMYNSVTIEL